MTLPDYVSVCFFYTGYCRAPPDPSRPQNRATPAPQGNTKCYRRKNGSLRQTRLPGASKGALPGKSCSVPGKGADPRGGKGFQYFRRRCSPGIVFQASRLGFQLCGRRFSGDGNYHPPGNTLLYSRVFCSAVERPAYCPQVTGSSLASCRVFFVLGLFIWVLASLLFLLFAGNFFSSFLGHYFLPPWIAAVSPFF